MFHPTLTVFIVLHPLVQGFASIYARSCIHLCKVLHPFVQHWDFSSIVDVLYNRGNTELDACFSE